MKYSLESLIECLLLVSDEPLNDNSIIKILDDVKVSKSIIDAVNKINKNYSNKAIEVVRVASGYRFQAKEDLKIISLN